MAQAGARFEAYVREAMSERAIPSLAQLARDSGIASSAWHGWFRGERQPRRNSLKLAGDVLSRTPEQLLAVWEGERPAKRSKAPDDLAAAIREQADAIRDLVEELRQSRLAQVSATTVAFEALGALGVRRGPEGTQDDTEREAPAGTPQ